MCVYIKVRLFIYINTRYDKAVSLYTINYYSFERLHKKQNMSVVFI